MLNHRQTILASRPAAMVLALSLVAGLSAPFVMLPRAQAAVTPLACTENNANGCTELSPTPPEDTVAVPPNIVLMLDDSGSMAWDVMPDYGFLSDTSQLGLINSNVNGVYYNPNTVYSVPPKADGSNYPQATFGSALENGFDSGSTTVDLSTYRGQDDTSRLGRSSSDVQYSIAVDGTAYTPNACPSYATASTKYPGYCYFAPQNGHPYDFYDNSNNYYYAYTCNSTKDAYKKVGNKNMCVPQTSFFTFSTTDSGGGYTRHYVAKNTGDCAKAGLSSAVCDETTTTQQNVANWFSYYHTRMLMAKSGLMIAFNTLSPNYRFGFGSINGNNSSYITNNLSYETKNSKYIAKVAPFGAGTDKDGNPITNNQRYYFWQWLIGEYPSDSTPLRRSLQAVGMYYQTAQPWTTMSGDPGYTSTGTNPTYACRASYTILTTDGFWNGSSPASAGKDQDGNNIYVTGAADANGPIYSPPAGATYTVTGYLAQSPFSGGGATSGGSAVASLADVATYYWENDLQSGLANEVAPSKADPAFWQHMTTFTMGLGFDPKGISPDGTMIPQIFAWAQEGGGTGATSAITGFSWPTPSPDNQGGIENIADLAHAAVNGHGDFFSVKSPDEMKKGFAKAITDINSRNVPPTTAAVNASVITTGALSFSVGYNTGDWSGTFQALTIQLNDDGTFAYTLDWDAEDALKAFHSSTASKYDARKVYSGAYKEVKDAGGVVTSNAFDSGFQFNAANKALLDSFESAALMIPASTGSSDTLVNRIKYILGDNTNEGTVYRTRSTMLGAIIRSQPVYVSYPSSNYYDRWPNNADGTVAAEADTGAQKYDAFVTQESTRPGTVYVGANDGMLHAFDAPVPTCKTFTKGVCTEYNKDTPSERWAFIPRAVYANLGNLSSTAFSYRPTVDETPVTRDVFFSDKKWHTLLTGGVGLGGRGVYALDITAPTKFDATDVLWEFDADATADSGCVASYGTCKPSDLGYTVSKPNIGRLHNGKWAVLVSNGYFPDCTTPDIPTDTITSCQAIAAQAPKDSSGKPYSALFVLDAETGKLIAELKTPTNISGVTSFGLATPVLGDYDNDQVDDVAFAGDVQGNLWRFNLSSDDPSKWAVTLAYKGLANASGVQGQQPITSQPRLFPDPASNRFIVLFGTGKFLGVGDNSNNTVQAIMGVRDQGNSATSSMAYSQSDLVQQYMQEAVEPAFLPDGKTPNPLAGVTVRCVTGSASDVCGSGTYTPVNDSMGSAGWFINLKTTASDGTQTDAGERVVVNPGAIFASNTVIFETLITGSANSDPCSPSTEGAILALNAVTGAASGVSALGNGIAGGRVVRARTSGSLPLVSTLGGGQVYLPGTGLAPKGNKPMSLDAPIWRRRSWQEINENQ